MIEAVSQEVDKTFDGLKEIEGKVQAVSEKADKLPGQLSEIENQVAFLTENKDSITDALDKVSEIKTILKDAEEKAEKLQSTREGLGRQETRLENMAREVDERIHSLAKYNGIEADMDAPLNHPIDVPENDLTPKDREQIVNLKRKGWTVEEISKSMKRSMSEIEIILEMGLDEEE